MADITRADITRIVDKLDIKLDLLIKQVTTLEALQATEEARCPFREEISKASNSVARLDKLEGRVAKLELTWAKVVGLLLGAGAIGGGVSQLLERVW